MENMEEHNETALTNQPGTVILHECSSHKRIKRYWHSRLRNFLDLYAIQLGACTKLGTLGDRIDSILCWDIQKAARSCDCRFDNIML